MIRPAADLWGTRRAAHQHPEGGARHHSGRARTVSDPSCARRDPRDCPVARHPSRKPPDRLPPHAGLRTAALNSPPPAQHRAWRGACPQLRRRRSARQADSPPRARRRRGAAPGTPPPPRAWSGGSAPPGFRAVFQVDDACPSGTGRRRIQGLGGHDPGADVLALQVRLQLEAPAGGGFQMSRYWPSPSEKMIASKCAVRSGQRDDAHLVLRSWCAARPGPAPRPRPGRRSSWPARTARQKSVQLCTRSLSRRSPYSSSGWPEMKKPIAAYSRFSVSGHGPQSWAGCAGTRPPRRRRRTCRRRRSSRPSTALEASRIIGSTAAKARARSGSMPSSAPAWTRLSIVRLFHEARVRRRARSERSVKGFWPAPRPAPRTASRPTPLMAARA